MPRTAWWTPWKPGCWASSPLPTSTSGPPARTFAHCRAELSRSPGMTAGYRRSGTGTDSVSWSCPRAGSWHDPSIPVTVSGALSSALRRSPATPRTSAAAVYRQATKAACRSYTPRPSTSRPTASSWNEKETLSGTCSRLREASGDPASRCSRERVLAHFPWSGYGESNFRGHAMPVGVGTKLG